MAVVSSELFLYGVTLHHTVSGISSRVIDFLRMRARGLRGRRGTVCGVGEYPRHIHEVAWDFGSVFCLASVHADVYCRTRRKFSIPNCPVPSIRQIWYNKQFKAMKADNGRSKLIQRAFRRRYNAKIVPLPALCRSMAACVHASVT